MTYIWSGLKGRYISAQGNAQHPELIRAAIVNLPIGGEVIAATDADEEGLKLADQIEAIAAGEGRAFRRHRPPARNPSR